MKRAIVAIVSAVFLFACSKEEKKPESEPAPAAQTEPTEVPEAPQEMDASPVLPTAVDFEEEAEAEITEDTLEEELEKVEKDLEPG